MCRKDGQDDGMSSFERFTMLWVVQKSGIRRNYMGLSSWTQPTLRMLEARATPKNPG